MAKLSVKKLAPGGRTSPIAKAADTVMGGVGWANLTGADDFIISGKACVKEDDCSLRLTLTEAEARKLVDGLVSILRQHGTRPQPDADTVKAAEVGEAAAAFGRLGGEAGTGESKRRGSKAHYRRLSALAARARARKVKVKAKAAGGQDGGK